MVVAAGTGAADADGWFMRAPIDWAVSRSLWEKYRWDYVSAAAFR